MTFPKNDFVEGDIDPNIEMFPTLEHGPVRSFGEVLELLDLKAKNNTEKGDVFELLVRSFMQLEPGYKSTYENVMLWSQWPSRPRFNDIGVDLVCQRRSDGKRVAIQCKFYGVRYEVNYNDVAKFFVASSLFEIDHMILVATTGLTRNARYAVDNWRRVVGREIQLEVKRLEMFEDSQVDWTKFNLARPVNIVLKDDRQLNLLSTTTEGGRLRLWDN